MVLDRRGNTTLDLSGHRVTVAAQRLDNDRWRPFYVVHSGLLSVWRDENAL